MCPFHCGMAVNVQTHNHTLTWIVIACYLHTRQSSHQQCHDAVFFFKKSPASARITFNAVFSRCGLTFWKMFLPLKIVESEQH